MKGYVLLPFADEPAVFNIVEAGNLTVEGGVLVISHLPHPEGDWQTTLINRSVWRQAWTEGRHGE